VGYRQTLGTTGQIQHLDHHLPGYYNKSNVKTPPWMGCFGREGQQFSEFLYFVFFYSHFSLPGSSRSMCKIWDTGHSWTLGERKP